MLVRRWDAFEGFAWVLPQRLARLTWSVPSSLWRPTDFLVRNQLQQMRDIPNAWLSVTSLGYLAVELVSSTSSNLPQKARDQADTFAAARTQVNLAAPAATQVETYLPRGT